MNLIKEVNKPKVTQTIVVYGGRFQPFHKGHYAAYERLVSDFGKGNVYIGTSNDMSSDKSPFSFKEKKEIATKMFGIPASMFVKVNNPYRPKEILDKYDGKITQYIAAVGQKDADRLKSGYFKPYKGKAGYGYDEVGYYYPIPEEENPISGTDVRKKLGSSNKEVAKKFFLKAYPSFDSTIFKMITSKLNEDGMPGGIGVGLVLPGGYINGAPTGSVDETNNTQPSSKMRPEPHPTRHETEHPANEPDWYKRNNPYKSVSEILTKEEEDKIFEEFLDKYFNSIIESTGTGGHESTGIHSDHNNDWNEFDDPEKGYTDMLPGWEVAGHLSDELPKSVRDKEIPLNNHFEENGPGKRWIHPTKGDEYANDKKEKWEMNPMNKMDKTYDPEAKYKTINENLSESKENSINHFIEYATKKLKLKETPKITLLSGREYSEVKTSLGGYNPMSKEIFVVIDGRLTADILRTLAHEMVHRKQDELGLVKDEIKDGATGSPIENQAHAVAGILMRNYGKINKQIYNESINIDVDKGDTVLMGKFKNKKVVVKDIGKDDYGMPTINGKKATTFRMGDKGQNIFKKDEVDEMKSTDIHFMNIIKLYRDSKFRKRINAYLFGNPNKNNPNDVAKALRNMGYDEITHMEKELNIQPNYDEQIDELYRDVENFIDNYLGEVSGNVGDDSQPDGGYLPKGKVRKLDANDGVNKSDDWFYSGGYIQTEFPVADAIWGDEDENQTTIKYTARNLPRFDEEPTEFLKEGLLLEGGAYGHMSHPFDDMDLTFGDLKNIIKSALEGDLGVVREKTDGQALAISWKNGRLIAARNKSHLANSGANAMGIDGVSSKFQGRGGLSDAYNYAMKDLDAAISSLSDSQRKKIFNEGKCFMNLEVIWPTSVNVIPYGQALLVFHNTICYDEKGSAVGADNSAASTLAGMIKQVNADVQSKYTIQGPPITSIPKSEDLSSKQGTYLSKLSKLQSEFGLKDNDNVADYHQAWWEDFITKSKVKLQKLEKDALIRRWAFGDKSFRLNTISNKDAQQWAMEHDKVNVAKQQKENIKPFEQIFLGVGADVLEFVGSVLTVYPDKAIRSMKSRLKSIASQVRDGGDPSKITKLKSELSRLNSLGGIDRIVASEGLVFFYNGKTYKLTGTFAPLNQILGIFYS